MPSRSEPRPRFRPSQLIYDTRYRSITLQVIALVLLVAGFAWLTRNTIINLSNLGKDFDFGFLFQRAGYDINQTLIPYTNDDSHLRAAFVGIANTLLIAVLGCIAATFVGVIAGVLRLSRNWLVARLMAVYVEGFRNVPLLLWIIFIMAVLSEATPHPRTFKEGGGSEMLLGSALTNRGLYIPRPVWEAGSAVVVGVFLASLVGIFFVRRASRARQMRTGVPLPVLPIALGLFLIPALLAFFVMGRPIGLEIPELGGFNFKGGIMVRSSLIALWLALTLYTGAFIAEIVRSGILAVPKGQTEAAAALGLRPRRITSLVVLPQALRVIVPPLISQYLNLTKNSSLAIAVGYMDVKATLGGITINQTGRELEGILLMGAFYMAISLTISFFMNIYNNSIKLKER